MKVKKKKKSSKPKPLATLTIRNASKLDGYTIWNIVEWLEMHASELYANPDQYSNRFTARYFA